MFKRLILHPVTAVLLTLIIIFTGVFGSLYSQEIRSSIAKLFNSSNAPLIFWILVLITGIFFFLRKFFEDRLEIDKIERLDETIRRMPSTAFLKTFHEIYFQNRAARHSMYDIDFTDENIEETIRMYLLAIITLIKEFDRADDITRYAINIMIYRSIESIDWDKTKASILFVEEDSDKNNLDGILIINKKLAIVSDGDFDDKLEEIALPVPKKKKIRIGNKTYTKVLPGAPTAYTSKVLSRFQNTEEIRNWCDLNGDFTIYVKTKISEYFNRKDEIIKAFASLPLINYDGDVIAVINIHTNKPTLLEGEEKLKQFYFMVNPFLIEIVELLSELNE